MTPSPSAGLCERCEHVRKLVSGKGSVFWRCAVADRIADWPKYPRLPVLRCPHYREPDPEPDPEPDHQ